jgi:uncharacterized protein YkwD
MLKCDFWQEDAAERRLKEVSHKNPYPKEYCCELTSLTKGNSLNAQIEGMIWSFLSSSRHREDLLNDYYTHAGVEIAHDANHNLTILTVRLSKI